MIRKEVKPTQMEKKKKAQPLTFSSLSEEIAENCLARISKWKYPNLSLVSKRFLTLLTSPELYRMRSQIGTAEPCLYFCLGSLKRQSSDWYTLWVKPSETLTDDNECPLVPLPSYSYHHRVPHESAVAVGWEICSIGAPYLSSPSSAVRILDCRNHTWRDGPSMTVARVCASAVVLGGKIYVMGGCRKDESMAWMEVLDVKTQTWSTLPSPRTDELPRNLKFAIFSVLEGKIYARDEMKGNAYDPKKGKWEVVETHSSVKWLEAWCVMENVPYCYTETGYCMWYDSKSRKWIEVKGSDLEMLRNHPTSSFVGECVLDMVDYGGKLLVMWHKFERQNGKLINRRLKCTKIALEKRGGEVWGKIEWTKTLLSLPESFGFVCCLVVSI